MSLGRQSTRRKGPLPTTSRDQSAFLEGKLDRRTVAAGVIDELYGDLLRSTCVDGDVHVVPPIETKAARSHGRGQRASAGRTFGQRPSDIAHPQTEDRLSQDKPRQRVVAVFILGGRPIYDLNSSTTQRLVQLPPMPDVPQVALASHRMACEKGQREGETGSFHPAMCDRMRLGPQWVGNSLRSKRRKRT